MESRLLTGFTASDAEYVLRMNGDFSHPPEVIARLWNRRENADVVVASRYVEGASAWHAGRPIRAKPSSQHDLQPRLEAAYPGRRLERELPSFVHHEFDIRDRRGMDLVDAIRPDFRIPGKARPRQYPQWRRRALHSRVRRSAARREVYNLGSGKTNSCSILKAFTLVERLTGEAQISSYVEDNRIGDPVATTAVSGRCAPTIRAGT